MSFFVWCSYQVDGTQNKTQCEMNVENNAFSFIPGQCWYLCGLADLVAKRLGAVSLQIILHFFKRI